MARRDRTLRHTLYSAPEGVRSVVIQWERFSSFSEACARFPAAPCLYTLQSAERLSLYVGKATGLRKRYAAVRGVLEALHRRSDVLLFAAPVERSLLELVEHTIIFWDCPIDNARGIYTRPYPHVRLVHEYQGVCSAWGSGGEKYQGPQFCGPGAMRDEFSGAMNG